jgi:hypothetical protein
MKGGLFEGRGESAILLLMCLLALIWSGTAFAGQKIRMYEMNSKLQQRSIAIGGAAEKAGCHDLLWGKRIYRFVQTGFQWCSLYEQESCVADSIVTAYWQDGKYRKYNIDSSKPQPKLYPGTKWIVDSAAADIQSWYCEAK